MKKLVFGVHHLFVVKLEKLDNAKYALKLSVHHHFSLRCFVPNTGKIRHRLFKKALPTINLNYKEGDGPVPFDELEFEDPDPNSLAEPMEVDSVRESVQEVQHLDEHNYSSNVSRKSEYLAKDLKDSLNIKILEKNVTALKKSSYCWKTKAKKVSCLQQNLRKLFPKVEIDHVVDGFENTRLKFLSIMNSKKKRKFPLSVREFAANVFFYSPRCYLYFRQKFRLASVALIRKWTSAVRGMPGFQIPASKN